MTWTANLGTFQYPLCQIWFQTTVFHQSSWDDLCDHLKFWSLLLPLHNNFIVCICTGYYGVGYSLLYWYVGCRNVMTYCICGTFDGDFNLAVWWFWLQSPNLMYANTTYNHVYYEAMYTEYCPVCQTKISTNVHYIPICQTYCLQIYRVYGKYF